MAKMISQQEKAEALKQLLHTNDINTWEHGFLTTVCSRVAMGLSLSEKQEDKMNDMYDKHFVNFKGDGYVR